MAEMELPDEKRAVERFQTPARLLDVVEETRSGRAAPRPPGITAGVKPRA